MNQYNSVLSSSSHGSSRSIGVAILSDRINVAEEISKRLGLINVFNVVSATNSLPEFHEAVTNGKTEIQLISYKCLELYADMEKNSEKSLSAGMKRFVCTWVNTYEIACWVKKNHFDGVMTHFDFSCRDGRSLQGLLLATSDLSPTTLFPTEAPTGPLAYKDQVDHDIAAMISSGMSDKEIADALYLSLQTIRNRVSRLLHDSGARNRTHLAMVYLTSLETFSD